MSRLKPSKRLQEKMVHNLTNVPSLYTPTQQAAAPREGGGAHAPPPPPALISLVKVPGMGIARAHTTASIKRGIFYTTYTTTT